MWWVKNRILKQKLYSIVPSNPFSELLFPRVRGVKTFHLSVSSEMFAQIYELIEKIQGLNFRPPHSQQGYRERQCKVLEVSPVESASVALEEHWYLLVWHYTTLVFRSSLIPNVTGCPDQVFMESRRTNCVRVVGISKQPNSLLNVQNPRWQCYCWTTPPQQ